MKSILAVVGDGTARPLLETAALVAKAFDKAGASGSSPAVNVIVDGVSAAKSGCATSSGAAGGAGALAGLLALVLDRRRRGSLARRRPVQR